MLKFDIFLTRQTYPATDYETSFSSCFSDNVGGAINVVISIRFVGQQKEVFFSSQIR